MNDNAEIWKDVIGFEGAYQVSDQGRIKSLSRSKASKTGSYMLPQVIMKLNIRPGEDARTITVRENGKSLQMNVAKEVAKCFIPNPENHESVYFIDGDKGNLKAINLKWVKKKVACPTSIIEIKYPGYSKIHAWIKSHYGRPNACSSENCMNPSATQFEWALIKGKVYEKNIDNFRPLCKKCHRNYDMTEEIKQQRRARSLAPIICFDLISGVEKSFESTRTASEELKISRTAIINCLKGRSKKSGSYLWKYQ